MTKLRTISRIVRTYPVNTSMSLSKESLFRKYIVNPPDKEDLGGFSDETLYWTTLSNYL